MNLLPHSIRWRIQMWHGLLLLLVLAGFGITAYQFQQANELRHLDTELQLRLSALHNRLANGPGEEIPPPPQDVLGDFLGLSAFPGAELPDAQAWHLPRELAALFTSDSEPSFYFRLWKRNGGLLGESANTPEDLRLPERQSNIALRTNNGRREVFQFTPPGECLLVGISETALRREMASFASWLTGIGGIVLVLGLMGGWWLATKAIAPIQDISSAATRIATGHLNERIAVAETDSELGQLAALLNDTFQRLEATFAEQARFTSDAAHELRTPVSVILAQTQLALSKPRSLEAHVKTIEMTRRSALRMQSLIESLLTLARADAHGETVPAQACDLADLSRENLEHIRPLADERGIALHSDLLPAPCKGDAGSITQIVTNLLANAVKYSRPGDEVRLTTGRENGHVLVRIADTGPGIEAEHLPHLFERFYRADASRNRNSGGAGLGLAICKTLAEAQGGRIEVSSQQGQGSTFTLRLPVG